MDISHDIVVLMNIYLSQHGKNPTTIHFTLKKENELILLPGYDISKSPREVFKKGIYGMKAVWGAKAFKVE